LTGPGPAFFSNNALNNNNAALQKASTPVSSSTRLDSTIDVEAEELTTSTTVLEDYVKERGGDRVLRKVLIANNGMAATKSIMSMRQWAYMELGKNF
jgi:acetyl-CoA carboxylase/biotin carboxylase 1